MTIYGPDIASYQGNPDMGAVRGGGNDFCIMKATESTGYVNPNFPGTRNGAHAAGMIVGLYHFARNTDPIAEARYFVNAIGGLRDNEFPVLDWEVPGDAANWSKVFLDEVQRLTGVKAFIYLNQYYVNNFDWSAVAGAGYPLWIAIYDGDPWTFPSMRFWGSPPLKQYTDAASISGIAGNVDRNSFNGSREQLLAYCKGGPTPTGGFLMELTYDEQRRVLAAAEKVEWLVTQMKSETDEVHGWLKGDDPDHDNLWLLWAALYGQAPLGNDNVITKALADLAAKVGQAQAPAVDEAKLAAALLADPKNVDALGAAIAAHLQLAPRAPSAS